MAKTCTAVLNATDHPSCATVPIWLCAWPYLLVASDNASSALIILAEHLAYKNLEVLAWLCVWSVVQMICIWSSWCHCHPIISCFTNTQNGLTLLVTTYQGRPGKEIIKWVLVNGYLTGEDNLFSQSNSSAAGDTTSTTYNIYWTVFIVNKSVKSFIQVSLKILITRAMFWIGTN